MAYKLLVSGKNTLIIDELFDHVEEGFDLVTTSIRYRDMIRHIEIYEPDIFVYCIYNEVEDDYKKMIEFKRRLIRQEINMVIIGSADDCAQFQTKTNNMADLVLEKPLTIETIQDNIRKYIKAIQAQREELKRMKEEQEKLAEENRRKHILVIDDDPLMLKLLKEYLHEKYDIATAISGKIAYKFLETRKTDMILLDYEMPVENGAQVLVKLRQKPELENVPILFLTGVTDTEKVREVLSHKPQGYLLKPIDKEKLISNVEKFLG